MAAVHWNTTVVAKALKIMSPEVGLERISYSPGGFLFDCFLKFLSMS